jgi:RNA polymerase subunit RPABC4/transcription elongation factor Spt4
MDNKCVCCDEIIPEGRLVCPGCESRERTDMRKNRYSVYHNKTEQPVIIYATATECAKAMGIKTNSFYRYICRMRSGKNRQRKWLVYEDEVEELEDGNA